MTRITVLMATRNGAAHLPAQLGSIAAQTGADWQLWVSDDGSTDGTPAILADFARTHPVRVLEGPGRGAAANFMSLLCHPDLPAGPVALADQDDIWHAGKLARAWAALEGVDGPALYGAASVHVDEGGAPIGASRPAPRGPSFENALVQNVVSGHSAALNAQALDLVRRAGPLPVPFHDWWLYALLSGVGARVILDAAQVLDYRAHGANVLGPSSGLGARAARAGLVLGGQWRRWRTAQWDALRTAQGLLVPEARALLDGLDGSGPALALAMRRAGLHRQGAAGTAALLALTALGLG